MNVAKYRKQAMRIITWQLIVVILLGLICGIFYNILIAKSAVTGGLIAFLPNLLFVLLVFSETGALAAKRIVKRFYLAEGLKLMITAILFVLALVLLVVEPLPLFIGFIITQMIFWFAPLIVND